MVPVCLAGFGRLDNHAHVAARKGGNCNESALCDGTNKCEKICHSTAVIRAPLASNSYLSSSLLLAALVRMTLTPPRPGSGSGQDGTHCCVLLI